MADDANGRRSSFLQSDWTKVLTLLVMISTTLILIGRWWGETQRELLSIGDTVKRLVATIEESAKHDREMELLVVGHEHRLKSLEAWRTERQLGGTHGGISRAE